MDIERAAQIIADGDTFWSFVSPGDPDECWEWEGTIQSSGYGYQVIGGKRMLAHRAAWVIEHQRIIPNGSYVCHHCDNRSCVNPFHLYIGLAKHNSLDAVERKRIKTKISESEAIEIIRLRNRGHTLASIAGRFDVSTTLVWMIANGQRWSHLREPRPGRDALLAHACRVDREEIEEASVALKVWRSEKAGGSTAWSKQQRENHPGAKLDFDKARRIRELNEEGVDRQALAEQFGVSYSTINLVLCGMAW